MYRFWVTRTSFETKCLIAAILLCWTCSLQAQPAIQLDCKELTESSGVAACLQNSEWIWTHNDSGGRPRLYLFSTGDGKLRAVYEIKDAPHYDWEDMCSFKLGGKNYLVIGDIGDNPRRRDHVEICIVEEPELKSHEIPARSASKQNDKTVLPIPARSASKGTDSRASVITTDLSNSDTSETGTLENPIPLTTTTVLSVRYPDGAYDCESLAFDPGQSRLILVTKDFLVARIFSVPVTFELLNKAATKDIITAKQIQTVPITLTTGADICAENRQLVICNYAAAYALDLSADDNSKWDVKNIKRVDSPKRLQGEAISYLDAKTLLFTSEGSPAPFWKMEFKFLPK